MKKRSAITCMIEFCKKETVFVVAVLLAVFSAFLVPPSGEYLDYIDFRVLALLFCLMLLVAGIKEQGVFRRMGERLIARAGDVRQLELVLIGLCFFSGMLITNDVALITFVPFALEILTAAGLEKRIMKVVVLQTIAANLGSMLTPIGNPQNLYLYSLTGMGLMEFILLMLPLTLLSMVILIIVIYVEKKEAVKTENIKAEVVEAETVRAEAAKRETIQAETVRAGAAQRESAKAETVKAEAAKRETIKTEAVKADAENAEREADKKKLIVYAVLFILCMGTVIRVIPWQISLLAVCVTGVFAFRNLFAQADYCLLGTFLGFFIFVGNMQRLPAVSELLEKLLDGRELFLGMIVSQIISNVPATMLLSGFTNDYKALLYGVDIGGLGTLIASLASLISYKYVCRIPEIRKGRYLGVFTLWNLLFLAILLPAAWLLLI